MQNVTTRARFVANIFDVLAWVVLGAGALAAVLVLLGGLGRGEFLEGLVLALVIAVYTVITWAGITLATLVASYIERRI